MQGTRYEVRSAFLYLVATISQRCQYYSLYKCNTAVPLGEPRGIISIIIFMLASLKLFSLRITGLLWQKEPILG